MGRCWCVTSLCQWTRTCADRRMNEGKSYVPPFELGKTSRRRRSRRCHRVRARPGNSSRANVVTSNFGWRNTSWPNAQAVASGQPRDSATLRLPRHPRHDGHDRRWAGPEPGGNQRRRRHFHFGSRPAPSAMWPGNWRNCGACRVIGSAGFGGKAAVPGGRNVDSMPLSITKTGPVLEAIEPGGAGTESMFYFD